ALVAAAQQLLQVEEPALIEAAIGQLLLARRLIAPPPASPAPAPAASGTAPLPVPPAPASLVPAADAGRGRALRVFTAAPPDLALNPQSPLALPAYWHTEGSLAARLRAVAALRLPVDLARVQAWLARWCARAGLTLAAEQEQ